MAALAARSGRTRSAWTRSRCRRRSVPPATTLAKGVSGDFAGAIDAAGTTKGVSVTTANFTQSAQNYVRRSPKRIVLIDGEELAPLMVRYGVRVRTRISCEVRLIDEDYFDQEESWAVRQSRNEVRACAAATFAEDWKDAVYEKGETQSFYSAFLDVFGRRRRCVAHYEEYVEKLDNRSGFINLSRPGVLFVEQKSAGCDLDTVTRLSTRTAGPLFDHFDFVSYATFQKIDYISRVTSQKAACRVRYRRRSQPNIFA